MRRVTVAGVMGLALVAEAGAAVMPPGFVVPGSVVARDLDGVTDDLLTAGLGAWTPLYTWGDPGTIRARFLQEPWEVTEPGPVRYSDLGYVLLGRVLERARGHHLSDFTLEEGLTFTPDPARTVSTEVCAWRGRLLTGETHDENAAALGGVAGHHVQRQEDDRRDEPGEARDDRQLAREPGCAHPK